MFKVFVLVPDGPPNNWKVKETEVVVSAADSRSSVRRLRRKYRTEKSVMVEAYPANQVPAYMPPES